MNGRRRGREEYERDNGSPPSAFTRSEPKRTARAAREQAEEEEEEEEEGEEGEEREEDGEQEREEQEEEEEDEERMRRRRRMRRGQGEEDWRGGMSALEKRAEFLRLCERAWDLFHS